MKGGWRNPAASIDLCIQGLGGREIICDCRRGGLNSSAAVGELSIHTYLERVNDEHS